LQIAVALGFNKVVLELNNSSPAQHLQSSDGGRSQISGLWHEIRELSRSFICFNVMFVSVRLIQQHTTTRRNLRLPIEFVLGLVTFRAGF
ncbi:hypothetical protein BAE44_0000597, partial [Dichanthelium oligosanthes]